MVAPGDSIAVAPYTRFKSGMALRGLRQMEYDVAWVYMQIGLDRQE